jgi:hypothetical protein
MAELPIDFPEAAQAWADMTESALVTRLEEPASKQAKVAAHWDEPDSPMWSILLANWLNAPGSPVSDRTAFQAKKLATLEQFLFHLIRWFRQAIQSDPTDPDSHLYKLVLVQQVALLYSKIHGMGLQRTEGNLLQVLFSSGHSTAIRLGVDFLLSKPPMNWADVSLSLAPLVQSKTWNVEDVFPRLLQSTDPSVLSPALDVSNHYFRSRKPAIHPAESEFESLLKILGGLVNQLGMLEENPTQFGDSVSSIQKILFDSVSLSVSLCDTLGQLGKKEAIGKLNQALKLTHRRIQTEAAFALAKLGDKNGEQRLLELASDFACRQRAVAYLEELGIEDRVDEKWTTAAALAESQLASWLAQNEQMGIVPARMELLDQRTLGWPGFDQPQECFLFRFEYDMQDSVFSNLGFAGPMSNSFSDDLANISMEDAYAIFAGWDIDHPDVYELPPMALLPAQRNIVNQWIESLRDRFDSVDLIFYGVFLEHQSMLARGKKGNESRVFVFDGDKLLHEPFPTPGLADPKLTYLLWRGRLFLQSSGYSQDDES